MKKHIKALLLLTVAFGSYHIATAQNETGYVSLFNGKNLNGWKSAGKNANFKVVDNAIVDTITTGANRHFLIADNQYGDFVLEMDVKIEGGIIDPGIWIHSEFNPSTTVPEDLAIGKSCKIESGSNKWSGSIYDIARGGWLYPMDLNTKAKDAYKPDEYNHVKIECIGNETKTWINNVAAADMVDTVANTGSIGLEVSAWSRLNSYGKKVYFKNIKIKTTHLKPTPFPHGVYVVNYVSNSLTPYEKRDGWKLLFDGKTAAGWHSAGKTTFPQKGWIVGNGLMTVDPQVKDHPSGGDILTDDQYSAFDLSFEFLTTPVANSGVKYFVTVDAKNNPLGLEYQVLDDKLHPDAKLGRNGDRTESSLYDLIPRNIPTGLSYIVKPVGQWNTGRIVVYPNNHVEHYLNGVKVLEYDRLSPEFKALIAISKYQHYDGFGVGPKGYILLQDHGCVVSFRSIKIKTLE